MSFCLIWLNNPNLNQCLFVGKAELQILITCTFSTKPILKSFYVNKVVLMQKEQMFWKWYSYLLFVWPSLAQKTILLTNTIRNVCLRAIPFQRRILYVGNNLVISLDTAAEQTRLCNGKLKGLSGPLRIPHKHRLDKPNFAQGSLHLPENWSHTFANTFKISLFSEPAKTIPPQGHIVFPWELWEILSYTPFTPRLFPF